MICRAASISNYSLQFIDCHLNLHLPHTILISNSLASLQMRHSDWTVRRVKIVERREWGVESGRWRLHALTLIRELQAYTTSAKPTESTALWAQRPVYCTLPCEIKVMCELHLIPSQSAPCRLCQASIMTFIGIVKPMNQCINRDLSQRPPAPLLHYRIMANGQ